MSTPRPLAGQKVVITRAAHQVAPLQALLEARGGEVVVRPTIELGPTGGELAAEADAALGPLAESAYDALLATSTNGVHFLLARLEALGIGREVIVTLPCFAVGPATAEALRAQGARDVVVAEEAIGEGLVDAIRAHYGTALTGKRFLLPRAKEGRDVVAEGLRAAGAEVALAPLYETRAVSHSEPLPKGPIAWVTFASPSAVRGFAATLTLPPEARIAVIGPVTAKAVRAQGWQVDVMPSDYNLDAMVEAMCETAS